MKHYAKYCKIKVKDKEQQLNLTESGYDTTRFFGKVFSGARFLAPLVLFGFLIKNIVSYVFFKKIDLQDLQYIISSGLITSMVCLPFTNVGKANDAILKNYSLKLGRKKYYKKMRELEVLKTKTNENSKRYDKLTFAQVKLTRKYLKSLEKETNSFKRKTKRYYKFKENKGYIDGLKSLALDNSETYQESIDKMIFHNGALFIKLCPEYKKFILDRMNARFNYIKDGNPYDDEFLDSIKSGEELVKNDCIDKNSTSNYLELLRDTFDIEVKQVQPISLAEEERKINKVYQKSSEKIYKPLNEELEK